MTIRPGKIVKGDPKHSSSHVGITHQLVSSKSRLLFSSGRHRTSINKSLEIESKQHIPGSSKKQPSHAPPMGQKSHRQALSSSTQQSVSSSSSSNKNKFGPHHLSTSSKHHEQSQPPISTSSGQRETDAETSSSSSSRPQNQSFRKDTGRVITSHFHVKKGAFGDVSSGNQKTTILLSQNRDVRGNGDGTTTAQVKEIGRSHEVSISRSNLDHPGEIHHESSSSRSNNDNIPYAKTARMSTTHGPVGDMRQTSIEGFSISTQAQHSAGVSEARSQDPEESTSRATSTPTLTPEVVSMAPPTAISVVTSASDRQMMSRQTQLATLSARDQETQHAWARTAIERFTPCPEGYAWERVHGGYQCEGRHHYVTDAQLAEGRGGLWFLPDGGRDLARRWGPYYAEVERPRVFVYCGQQPRPLGAPPFIDDGASWNVRSPLDLKGFRSTRGMSPGIPEQQRSSSGLSPGNGGMNSNNWAQKPSFR